MHLETATSALRPITSSDTHAIAEVVFSDPDVVCMLAHNTKDPQDALEEARRWTAIMGLDGDGGIWDEGGMGLFAILPKDRGDRLAGVAGFYMERSEKGLWNGEYFYALGSEWHGQGLMSEIADLFARRLKAMDNLGIIYGAYWDLINEASGRLLKRTGFESRGRKSVTKEYSVERCERMFEYDLWRLNTSNGAEKRDAVLLQAARRAGAFVAEDVITKDQAIKALTENFGANLTSDASKMLEVAIAQPGMAYLEIRGPEAEGPPINRLG